MKWLLWIFAAGALLLSAIGVYAFFIGTNAALTRAERFQFRRMRTNFGFTLCGTAFPAHILDINAPVDAVDVLARVPPAGKTYSVLTQGR